MHNLGEEETGDIFYLCLKQTNYVCLHDRKKLSLQKDDILSYCGGPCHCSSFETVENSLFYSVMG